MRDTPARRNVPFPHERGARRRMTSGFCGPEWRPCGGLHDLVDDLGHPSMGGLPSRCGFPEPARARIRNDPRKWGHRSNLPRYAYLRTASIWTRRTGRLQKPNRNTSLTTYSTRAKSLPRRWILFRANLPRYRSASSRGLKKWITHSWIYAEMRPYCLQQFYRCSFNHIDSIQTNLIRFRDRQFVGQGNNSHLTIAEITIGILNFPADFKALSSGLD